MYPIAHAMSGLIAGQFGKGKKVLALLVGMLLAIAPDFDFTFNILKRYTGFSISWMMHRNISHTIFPVAFLVGFLTLYLFKSYWMGFSAIALHWLLDVVDGGAIPYFPGLAFNFKYSLMNIIPNYRLDRWGTNAAGFNDVTISAIVGVIILLIVIGIEILRLRNETDKNRNI